MGGVVKRSPRQLAASPPPSNMSQQSVIPEARLTQVEREERHELQVERRRDFRGFSV
jgi:hypothetical protein